MHRDASLPGSSNFRFELLWRIGESIAVVFWSTPVIGNRPVLTVSGVGQASGNMSFSVASVSQSFPFSSYKVTLAVGADTGPATPIVAESSYATIAVPNAGTVRVYWSDLGDEGNLNDGDSFRVTRNGVLLASGSYTFYLLWSADNAQIQTKTWLV